MSGMLTIARREFLGYFSSPLAPVFLVIFLSMAAALPFYVGGFFERNIADLEPFFSFHPWLYMILVPAIGMRLWAEERRTGTIELLMTLPITPMQAVVGKFIAAWAFLALALALTFPILITVNWLGQPDNGVIVASYIASWLMAGAMLAVCSAVSAMTSNQVVAFVLGVAGSFLLLMSGLEIVLGFFRTFAPRLIVDLVATLSLLTHFTTMTHGVIDVPAVIYFTSLMAIGLFVTVLVVGSGRSR